MPLSQVVQWFAFQSKVTTVIPGHVLTIQRLVCDPKSSGDG